MKKYKQLAEKILDIIEFDDFLPEWREKICLSSNCKNNEIYQIASLLILAESRKILFDELYLEESELLNDNWKEIAKAKEEIHKSLTKKYGETLNIYKVFYNIFDRTDEDNYTNMPGLTDYKSIELFQYIENNFI